MANIEINGAPDKGTVGDIRDICIDLVTGKKYECVGIYTIADQSGTTIIYDWKPVINTGTESVEIDDTLTKTGEAADAKAVGDAVTELTNKLNDKVSTQDITNAVENALSEAKESGVFDGEKGEKGDQGETPVKGVDYFTEEDKTEIVNKVLASLPDGNEVAY